MRSVDIEDISQLQDYIVDREKGKLKDLGEVYKYRELQHMEAEWQEVYSVEIMRSGNGISLR